MSGSTSSIRGARVGAGPMGEQDRGQQAERVTISFFCSNGHSLHPSFASTVPEADLPIELDCPSCGLPAGRDKDNPPLVAKIEPYKTHLAYVKERRTEAEAQQILSEALEAVRDRRKAAIDAANASQL